MKLFALIAANLKGFIRKPRNIFLLVLAPLLLIGIIFLAFNPNGLRKVDLGFVVAQGTPIDELQLQTAVGSFARVSEYESLDACLDSLRRTREYVCLYLSGVGPFKLDVYYDNTREPVIWEVIERIKQAVQYVQDQQSRAIASDFLSDFKAALSRLDSYDQTLQEADEVLSEGVESVDESSAELQQARSELVVTLTAMDQDIYSAKRDILTARSTKDNYVADAQNALYAVSSPLAYLSALNGSTPYASQAMSAQSTALQRVQSLDIQIESKLDSIENQLSSYEQKSEDGRVAVQDIEGGLTSLSQARNTLVLYRTTIGQTRAELDSVQASFAGMQQLDADTLINPVVIYNTPAYVPRAAAKYNSTTVDADKAAQGLSLISLQTIFPMILLLITLFLSLLLGIFVALGEVNARTSIRLRLIQGMFFAEFFATLISALVIVSVPVIVVLLIGEFLFQLGMLGVLTPVLLLLLLVTIFFVLSGICLAYLIRRESIALMVSTFVLVLLIFLSGFLLPIERMSPLFALIAYLNPGSIAVSVFKQVVFYELPMSAVSFSYYFLIAEIAALLGVTLLIKKIRR